MICRRSVIVINCYALIHVVRDDTFSLVRDHRNGEVYFVRVQQTGRGDAVESRLQRGELCDQQRGRRFDGRELLENLQQIGQVPVTPVFVNRAVLYDRTPGAAQRTYVKTNAWRAGVDEWSVSLTVANSVRFFLSVGLVAHEAKNCSMFGVGGVVMSKNRVNRVRSEHLGSFSCGDQFFDTPNESINIDRAYSENTVQRVSFIVKIYAGIQFLPLEQIFKTVLEYLQDVRICVIWVVR